MDSDQGLIMTTFKLKMKAKYCCKTPWLLLQPGEAEGSQGCKSFSGSSWLKICSLPPSWQRHRNLVGDIKEVLLTTAGEVLCKRWKKIQAWITNEVLDQSDKTWELREKKHSSDHAQAWYQNIQRQVRKKMWTVKEEWIVEQCSTIEKGMETGDSKKTYSILKSLTKTSQSRTVVITDQDGKLLKDSENVLESWTE